ncbi:M24 family metallopeptidase [Alphaproteobacteria bacterium LSUCC0684]
MLPQRGFPRAEFEARLDSIQGAMTAQDLEVILLTSEHDIRYITGFRSQFWQSPTRPWFVVVPARGLPEAVIPTIGVPLMERGFIGKIHSWPSPAAPDDGINLLAGVIRAMAGTAPGLGMLMGRETKLMMPLSDLELLKQAIGSPEPVDATEIFRIARMVKSEAEIAKIRHTCRLASQVFEQLPGWASAGMPLADIFRRFKIKALEAGLDDVSYLVGAAGQGGYGDIISPPGDEPLQPGDVLMLDTGCCWDGYFCDFDRNFAVGNVSSEAEDAHALLWQATEDALTQIKIGMTSADLFAIMAERLGTDGDGVGRFGHGLGMQLTEPPSHISWDQTVLQENMVLTLEPSVEISEGRMLVHEENIVLRSDGVELLTTRASAVLPRLQA